jgi:hypothetical protein
VIPGCWWWGPRREANAVYRRLRSLGLELKDPGPWLGEHPPDGAPPFEGGIPDFYGLDARGAPGLDVSRAGDDAHDPHSSALPSATEDDDPGS